MATFSWTKNHVSGLKAWNKSFKNDSKRTNVIWRQKNIWTGFVAIVVYERWGLNSDHCASRQLSANRCMLLRNVGKAWDKNRRFARFRASKSSNSKVARFRASHLVAKLWPNNILPQSFTPFKFWAKVGQNTGMPRNRKNNISMKLYETTNA